MDKENHTGRRVTYGGIEEEHELPKKKINFVEEEKPKSKKTRHKKGRCLFIFVIILVGLFALLFARAAKFTSNIESPLAYDPVTLEPKKPEGFFKRLGQMVFQRNPELIGQKKDRINVLLLGMGGLGHDGPFLTDTIIVASIKPSTGQIAMTSIPRDLEVDIPGHQTKKINHANHFGEQDNPGHGAELTLRTIEKTFDIKIPYYVRVDFQGFKDIIDSVDGVNINVERSFVDTEYPAPNNRYQTVVFSKGPQEMDGGRALTYARSRHGNNGEGSDFARARRQQKLLLALKQKMLSFQTLANPIRLNNILSSVEDHLTTNMSFSDMITFLKLARDLDSRDEVSISTFVIDTSPSSFLTSGFNRLGEFVLTPKTGSFDDINNAIEDVFTYVPPTPDTTPQQSEPDTDTLAKIEIQNATWQAGMAARTREKLRNERLLVSKIGNTTERPLAESGIYQVSGILAPDTIESLQTILGISPKEEVPAGEIYSSSTDILVILGEDFVE